MPSQSNSESQLTPDAVASTIKTETLRMGGKAIRAWIGYVVFIYLCDCTGQVLAVNRKAWLRQFIDEHNVVYGVSDMTAVRASIIMLFFVINFLFLIFLHRD